MSVMMVLRIDADPKKLEERAAADPDGLRAISQKAASYGMIAHRFYESAGQIVVVDEWPDEQSFMDFFNATQETIGAMFQSIGMSGQPHPEFWHKLDTHDEVGWGA
ncbi:MAG TPA: hypothetical protein VFP55_02735 [Solirubrobacteraceae bacterium]|nr:hypothetical protein [Solirubrobacteraceae bacterium]